MNPGEDKFSDANDNSFPSIENDESRTRQADRPDHPVRQMIRRVRGVQFDDQLLRGDQANLHTTTWDRELDTPGSTEHSNLQSLASCLENYSQLLDSESIKAELPNQIGRFKIREILGAGGFGWVLLADDPQLNRPVALKVPRLDTLASQTGRARFLREARAAALLSHPNIVAVYEAGQIGPVLYIAFEWVDGQSLSQWLTVHRAELSSEVISRLMTALAHAVQHAHQRGIIHRDLKPSNILIKKSLDEIVENGAPAERGALSERAKIADFGLAFLGENDGELTRSGAMMGTPRYLAPEQIQSSGAPADPTIDVYGLGAVMYELLTGQPPFSGPTLAAIVRAVELDLPTAPRKLNSAVPKDLEAICLKCLEKNPARRYTTAAALAEDLERFTDGIPVHVRRPNFLERAYRWVQRNRLVTLAFAIAMLSLTVGLVVAASQAYQAKANFAESQQQRQRAERHRDRGELVVDSLLNEFSDSLEAIPQMQPLRRRLLQVALDHERASMADEGDDPESHLRVAESLGRIADLQYRLGDFAEASDACREVQQMVNRLPSLNSDQTFRSTVFRAKSHLLQSRILLNQGAAAKVEAELSDLLTTTTPAEADSNSEMARLRATALSLRGTSLRDQGKIQAAELSFLESISTYRNIPQADRTTGDERDIISILSMIGGLRYSQGKYDEAIEIWKEVAEEEGNHDANVPQQNILLGNRAAGLANLAMAYSFKKDYRTALEYYDKSNGQYQALCLQFPLHFDHASGRLSALVGRSVALQNAGQAQSAIESYREAVAWGEQLIQSFGEQPRLLTEVSRALGNLGNVLQFKGDQEAAMDAWNRGLDYVRKNLELQPDNGTNLSDLTFALGNLAAFHLQENQLDEASTLIDEALPAAEQAIGRLPGNQKVINAFRNLRANRALLFCFLRNHDQAIEEIARIVALQSDRPDTIVSAAKAAARCQLSVNGNLHELFGNEGDEEVALRYRDLALELLATVRDLGFTDFASLRRQPEFSQIVTCPEFERLLSPQNCYMQR
jgi:serine/threonine protein kinase